MCSCSSIGPHASQASLEKTQDAWQNQPPSNQSYSVSTVIGAGGGMMKHPMPGAPSMWLAYVEVADIEAATAKAKSLGAQVIQDVMEVMGAGWLSIISDPTGAVLGLWKSKGQ